MEFRKKKTPRGELPVPGRRFRAWGGEESRWVLLLYHPGDFWETSLYHFLTITSQMHKYMTNVPLRRIWKIYVKSKSNLFLGHSTCKNNKVLADVWLHIPIIRSNNTFHIWTTFRDALECIIKTLTRFTVRNNVDRHWKPVDSGAVLCPGADDVTAVHRWSLNFDEILYRNKFAYLFHNMQGRTLRRYNTVLFFSWLYP